MKLGRTIVFTLLFVVVCAIYVYQTRLTRQVLTNVPDEVNRTVVISSEDAIDRIELRDHLRKTQIALRKENGTWTLEVPVRYLAESQVAEGLVGAARMASRQPRLRAEKEWGEYGLAKPELEVTFDLSKKKAAILLIGSQTPVGKAVFARWDDERGYFLLPAEMKSVFRQSVYGLREKRLFRAPVASFRKIYIEMGEHSCQWKKDGEDWYWFEPVSKFGQKIPAGQMDAVLEALQNLYVKEFQDNNKKSKAELGFFMIHDRIRIESEGSPPATQGEARPSSQGGKTETFYFGNEVPDRNAYYGFREGEDTVFFVERGKAIELLDLMRKIQSEDPSSKTRDPRLEMGRFFS